MSEYRPTLERELERLQPPRIPFDQLERRRDRTHRNQRMRAGALGVVIAIALAGLGIRVIGSERPADPPPPAPTTPPPAPTGLFAPAAGWIVFTTDPYGDDQELVAVDPDDPQRMVTLAPIDGGLYTNPIAWSPDGSRLLLLRDRGGRRDLSVLSSDGWETELQRGFVFGGSFSPDGSKVVYGLDGDLYVVASAGGTPRLLAEGGDGLLASPAWSPDGSRIAFIDYGEELSEDPAGIFMVNADGTERQVLVDGRNLGQDASWGLSWSPDGTRLAFAVGTGSPGGPRGSIYLVDANGSGLQELTAPGEPSWPVWSPDGSRLAFVCRPPGDFYANLCIVPVAGGDVTRFSDVSFVMDDALRTVAWHPVP